MPATRKNGISQRNFCARYNPNGTPKAAAGRKGGHDDAHARSTAMRRYDVTYNRHDGGTGNTSQTRRKSRERLIKHLRFLKKRRPACR